MAKLNIKNGIVENYTYVLSTRDYRHLGQLTGIKDVNIEVHENSADILSFSISKYDFFKYDTHNTIDSKLYMKIKNAIWNQIEDFKLIWVKELNAYFEIKSSSNDSFSIEKYIEGKSLCECELSQILLTAEINTETDINRDDYEVTVFYNESNPNASFLNRIFSVAPHYKIVYVDDTLKNIQRTFSVDGTCFYDFLIGDCSEQFNCLFKFDSATRGVYVYDLMTICNDCGERGDFYDQCPKCGSQNLKYYGDDTTILVDKNNLTDAIRLEVNSDNIKNCFKLEAGDDLMTATVRMLNPNGSDYIYHMTEYQKNDMSEGLVNKLRQYQSKVDSYKETHSKLVNNIYELTDKILELESTKMPTIEHSEVTAETEAGKLNSATLSPLGLSNVSSSTSSSTVDSALKNYAKIYVKSGYVKVEIDSDSTFQYKGLDKNKNSYGTWYGRFKITNYSDEKDISYTNYMTITVYDNYEEFVRQKVLKTLSQGQGKDDSVFDALAIEDLETFKNALKLYCKNRLQSFYDAIQGAIDVLIQMEQGSTGALLYNSLYKPYYNKLQACQDALDSIQHEIDIAQDNLNKYYKQQDNIRKDLDMKTNLDEYYNEFCSYKREDIYRNANYISDGLTNTELIDRAKEFIEAAEKELYKSAEQQVTISSTLYNLLAIEQFKPIVDYFELGNWIRVKVDGVLYRLRLISYSIKFDEIQKINVEFANATKNKNVLFDIQKVISSAQSMSTSYGYVCKQAEKGIEAKNSIKDFTDKGLDAGLVQIKNNEHEEIIYDKHGLLCRHYDEISGTYDPKQSKFTHNTLAFTNNNWKSVEQVLGEHSYITYDAITDSWTTKTGYGITSKFSQSAHINGSTIVGGIIYSSNYSNGTNEKQKKQGTFINLDEGTFSFAGGNLRYDGETLLIGDADITQALINTGIVNDQLYIDASKITGKLTSNQIVSINANQVASGIFDIKRIPDIDASKTVTGTFSSDRIPNLNADKINNGTFSVDRIPNLSASKITSGTLSSDRIANTLNNKTLSGGSLEMGYTSISSTGQLTTDDATIGHLHSSTMTTYDNSNVAHTGITGEYTVGNSTINIVNGIIVGLSN